MEFETIEVEKKDYIGILTLNRPKSLNALTGQMGLELDIALDDFENDDNIRTIIMTGKGRAFSAGGDLGYIPTGRPADEGKAFMDSIHKWFLRFYNLPKPTIASVNGIAVGAGFNIALAADIIIASENAVFGQAFVQVGAVPDMGGLYFLPRIIGLSRAKELFYTGENISAKQAFDMGILNRLVPHEDLEKTTMDMAKKFCNSPIKSMALTKAVMHRGLSMDLKGLLELEAYAQGVAFEAKEHVEGSKAFFQKRKAKFPGAPDTYS